MLNNFRKITPVNGFDKNNPDNAMQNNYAWSMEEMGDYLYVGTGRDIFYLAVTGTSAKLGVDIKLPQELTPESVDLRAEIWRYNKKKPSEGWTRVLKAPQGVIGFRFMIRYTTPRGETALYAGSFGITPGVTIFKSNDGVNWRALQANIPGTSTRAMIIHFGKLYMSSVDEGNPGLGAQVFVSTDPEREGWKSVTGTGTPGQNPSDQVAVLASFNDHIYAGVNRVGGFELWRSEGTEAKIDCWKLVIDKGAGDATNEIPLTLGTFGEHLYVGAIIFPLATEIRPTILKPFDLIRIDKNDFWELVIGGPALEPTDPTTGVRSKALSLLPSGAGNPFNLYCWQLQEYKGEFYLGTFDWLVLVPPMLRENLPLILSLIAPVQAEAIEKVLNINSSGLIALNPVISGIVSTLGGFDLFKSSDGVHWQVVTLNGLGNPHNYGARNLFPSDNGNLYLGTSNVFEGCEVWVKQETPSYSNISDLFASLLKT